MLVRPLRAIDGESWLIFSISCQKVKCQTSWNGQADFNAVHTTLEKFGQPSLNEMLIRNHVVHELCWRVKLGDMKPIVRKFKHRQDLTRWLERARGGSLAGHTTPRLLALGPHACILGPRWIELKNARKRSAGWVVLGMLALSRSDDTLDMQRLRSWMQRVGHPSTMNAMKFNMR